MPSLEDFLEQQIRGEIQVEDSDFTLAPKLAREKLRTFQEDLPCYALLRLTQGLILAGAKAIEIEVGEKEFDIVALSLNQTDFIERLKTAYQGTKFFEGSASSICALACHALQLYALKSLTINHQGNTWPIVRDEDEPKAENTNFHLKAQLNPNSSESFLNGIPDFKKRCRFSNITITVAGETLRPTIAPTLRKGTPQSLEQLEFHTEWVLPGSGFQFDLVTLQNFDDQNGIRVLQRYKSGQDTERAPLFYGGLGPGFQNPTVDVQMAVGLALTVSSSRQGLWVFLRQGIVTEAIPATELFPNSVALVDVSDLATDLSGLRTIDSEALTVRKQQALELMGEACRQSATLLPKHWRNIYDTVAPKLLFEFIPYGKFVKFLKPIFGKFFDRMTDTVRERIEDELVNEIEALEKWCREMDSPGP